MTDTELLRITKGAGSIKCEIPIHIIKLWIAPPQALRKEYSSNPLEAKERIVNPLAVQDLHLQILKHFSREVSCCRNG